MNGMSINSRKRTERSFVRESSPMWGYVQKDTLDAHMQRLEALMERNMVEQKAMNDQLKAEMKSMNDRLENKIDVVRSDLRADIKVLDSKIYSLDERLSQILVIVSIIATIFGIIIAAIQFWK